MIGIDPTTLVPCPTCDGTGTIGKRCRYDVTDPAFCDSCKECVDEPCPDCDGNGEVTFSTYIVILEYEER